MDDRLITLQRLIQAQPDDTDLRLELASALQGAGERRRAVVEYSRVAVAMVNRHALQDAAAVCKLVLDLAPDHAPTHELLLDICGLDDALAAQTARIIAAMHGIKIPAARPAPRPPPAPAAEEEFILLAAPKVVATAQPVAIARSADLESGPPASTRRLRPRSVPTAPPSSAGISINLPATSSSEPGAGRLAAPASEDPFDDFGANGVSTIDRLKAMARARQLGQLEELPGVRGAAPALAPTPLAGPTPSPPATPWPAQAPQPTDAATAARRTEDEVLELDPDDLMVLDDDDHEPLSAPSAGPHSLDFSDLYPEPTEHAATPVPLRTPAPSISAQTPAATPLPRRAPRRPAQAPVSPPSARALPAAHTSIVDARALDDLKAQTVQRGEPVEQTSLVDMDALVRAAEARRGAARPLRPPESTSVVDVQRLETLARGSATEVARNEPVLAGEGRRGHHRMVFDASTRVATTEGEEAPPRRPAHRDVHSVSTIVASLDAGRTPLPDLDDATRPVPAPVAAALDRLARTSRPSSGRSTALPRQERPAPRSRAAAPPRATERPAPEPEPIATVSADQLANVPLLAGLPLAVTNGLMDVAFVQRHPAGTVLLEPGMDVIGVAVVLDGEVVLSDLRARLEPVVLRAGDFFGQEQYLTGQASTWRAETRRETVTLFLVPEVLAQLGERDPSIWDALWRQVVRE